MQLNMVATQEPSAATQTLCQEQLLLLPTVAAQAEAVTLTVLEAQAARAAVAAATAQDL